VVPLLGLVGVLVLTALAVAVFRVPQNDLGTEEVETTDAPSVEPASEQQSVPEEAPAVVTVVGSGLRVEQILRGTEFGFFSETGLGVNVLDLASPGLVWELTNDNRNRADVIEVGFRLDALSGSGDDSLLPIDPAQIPSLAPVDEDFLLEARGIVPFIDGAVGLVSSGAGADELSDWADLQTAVDRGATVVVPAPPSDLAVVFVWALGDGDPERGVERYAELIDGGALAVRTTSDFIEVAGSGPVVGAWSSSGVVRAQRTVSDIEFLVPSSGAVALPGFAGILAETEQPEAAHRWLNFRLETILQTAMTFGEVTRQFDRDPPIPRYL
jgi:spermidine/putrescine-binding protein